MYTPEQQLLLDKFAALAAKEGSQNKACEKVGISAAIMSQLRKEIYPGDVDSQFAKLGSYFGTKEAAAALASAAISTEYKPTGISTDIYEQIRGCQLMGGLAVLGGKAGIGKTMAAKKFVSDHPNDAILITLNPCLSTLRSVLQLICGRLSIPEKTINEMWNAIAAKLRDGMVIIVDESQNCPYKVIEALRALADYFADMKQTLGIVFIGNIETTTNFSASKNEEFDQIANRTKFRKSYRPELIRKEDIQMLFPDLAGAEEVEWMLKISQSSSALRGAQNLYNNARNNGDTSYAGLVAMAKHMQMRV